MASKYPGSLDDATSLPDPSATDKTNLPSHAGLHDNENAAIKALEAKVGIGASTPPGSGYLLTSSSTGTSSWQAAPAAGVWGAITGTLSNQTDLQTALNAKVSLSGGTMTGLLILSGDPSTALGAATKQYADTKLSLAGDITGGTAAAPQVTATHLASALPVAQGGTGTTTSTGTGSVVLSTSPVITTGTVTADPTVNLGIASKQYVDKLGTTSLIRNETPGGLINGSNTAYTTASTFATGSLKVYLNGQRLAPGSGVDYVEVTQGFTMQYAPATGDVLLVDYETTNTAFIQGSNSIIVNETPSGTVNGTTTLFTVLQGKYVANTLEVFINGLQQIKTTDFTETSPGSGTFTFTTAPLTGDVVRVSYQFSTGASGNADTVDGIHASATPTANQLLALDSSALVPTAALGGAYGTWSPTISGFSANPTGGIYSYNKVGKMVTLNIAMPNTGTSNATTIGLTLPFTAATRAGMTWVGYGSIIDNGVAKQIPGMITIGSGGTGLTIVLDFQFNAFTASGNKSMQYGTVTYEAA